MIHTIEWITNTATCGGLIAGTVFTIAVVIYVRALRWLNQAKLPGEDDQP